MSSTVIACVCCLQTGAACVQCATRSSARGASDATSPRDNKRGLVYDTGPPASPLSCAVALSTPTVAVSVSDTPLPASCKPFSGNTKRKRPDSDVSPSRSTSLACMESVPSQPDTPSVPGDGDYTTAANVQQGSQSAPTDVAVSWLPESNSVATATSESVSSHRDIFLTRAGVAPAKNTPALSSDSDNYSDAAEPIQDSCDSDSDSDYGDEQKKGDGEGDDCGSECEDDRSVVSGITVASTGSLTPSLVGETLGFISLVETPSNSQPASAHLPAPSPAPLPVSSRAFTPSLFPHVPCAINFGSYTDKCVDPPAAVSKLMRWRLSTITPQLLRQTLINSNFRLLKQTPNWLGTWGKHMRPECFKSVRDFQKTNHFPGTFQIGRKDKLWRNIHALQLKFGKQEFGFVPRTYVLPGDMKALRAAWRKEGSKRKWIVKPPASARGTGISVIQHWSELPRKKQVVVQRYVSRPLLIDERKFDLRLYVYVSSFNPLRVYIYEDGLVRFASVKYSNTAGSLHDTYMHLTNYSVNKHSADYLPDGHKWSLRRFWRYLAEQRGADPAALWRRVVDLVLKTLVAGERHVVTLQQQHVVSHYSCHELLGFDVLIDERLRPWLLEVNISPSLHSSAPIDVSVKAPMVRDLLNMASFHLPNRLSGDAQQILRDFINQSTSGDSLDSQSEASNTTNGGSSAVNGRSSEDGDEGQSMTSGGARTPLRLVLDKRLYTSVLGTQERLKHAKFANTERSQYLDAILETLTPDDVRHLVRAEDEYSRRGGFIRVFPTAGTHHYLQYMETPRYHNKLLDAWEQRQWRRRRPGIELLQQLCSQRTHLVVPKNYLRRKEFTPEVVAHAEELRKAHLTAASFAANGGKGQKPRVECSTMAEQSSSRTTSSDSGVDAVQPHPLETHGVSTPTQIPSDNITT